MDRSATGEDVLRVVAAAERLGLKAHPIPGAQRTAVGITGNKGTVGPGAFESLPGVLEVIRVSHPYKLVSREFHPEDTIVSVGGVPGGGTQCIEDVETLSLGDIDDALKQEARLVKFAVKETQTTAFAKEKKDDC